MQIKYNGSQTIRFEFPLSWDTKAIDAVVLSVSDMDGYVIQTKTCTLFSPLKLAAAASEDEFSITLNGTVVADDWIRLEDGYGLKEDVEIESFNFGTKVATLKHTLRKDHVLNSDAYGLWCTATISTTNLTYFPVGEKLILSWTPDVGFPVTQRAEIGIYKFQVPNLIERFSNLHPREYDVLSGDGRLEEMLDEAINQLGTELRLRGIFIDKVADTNLLIPCLLAKIRFLVLANCDGSYDSERGIAKEEFTKQFELLCASDVFQDINQDLVIDESIDHGMFFERGF